MGTTLATVHVYKQNPQNVQAILPKDCVHQISQDWTSVLDIDLGDSEKLARKLSKTLEAPAIAFDVYDDDLITLKLFSQGKVSAQYIMTEEYEPYLKHCDQFITALGWDENLFSRLRKILKCGDLGSKIDMLEEFFGVAFYVHSEFIADGAQNYVKQRGDAQYKTYEAEQKKINRIKNKTNAVLTQEINAKGNGHAVWNRHNLILLSFRKDGIYNSDECSIYKLDKDQLKPIIEGLNVPITDTLFFPFRKGVTIYNSHKMLTFTKSHKDCLLVAWNGAVLGEITLPETFYGVLACLEDGSLLCSTGGLYLKTPLTLHCRSIDGPRWNRVLESSESRINPKEHNGYIYWGGFEHPELDKTVLYKLDLDGNVIVRRSIPFYNTSNQFQFNNDRIYLSGYNCISSDYTQHLLIMDDFFNIIEDLPLPGLSISREGLLDSQRSMIYFEDLGKRLVSVNLNTLEYQVVKPPFEIYLDSVDKAGLIYGIRMTLNWSTLCVLDPHMNLISKHRLKGHIASIQESETGIHVVTCTGDVFRKKGPEDDCFARVYRIDRI